MLIVGHGIDIVELPRFRRLYEGPAGGAALSRCFTPSELSLVGNGPARMARLAGHFAAKEAVLKALGTGWTEGIAFTDIEIRTLPSGAPSILLVARAEEVAATLQIGAWFVSISHSEQFAVASAIAVANPV